MSCERQSLSTLPNSSSLQVALLTARYQVLTPLHPTPPHMPSLCFILPHPIPLYHSGSFAVSWGGRECWRVTTDEHGWECPNQYSLILFGGFCPVNPFKRVDVQSLNLVWGYRGLGTFGCSLQEFLVRLREFIVDLLWWDEDGCRGATVEVGIVTSSLVRNSKHPVDVIVSGVESGGPDSNCQLIHLVLRNLFDSGECPLLAQRDTERIHGVENFRCSTTSLQVERDGAVHLVCKVIPRKCRLTNNE